MRIIFTALFVVIFLILSIPVFFIEWIIGKFNMPAKMKSSLAIVSTAFKIVIFLSGTKVTVTGMDKIPKDTAVMYAANHHSFFDIVITYSMMPSLTGYIAKKEILKVPLLRVWMRYLNCLFLDRSDIKAGAKTILEAIAKIKAGISIFIFPEGTRCKIEGETLPFHEGSFKIATKGKCPIIPVCITKTNRIFEDHLPWIKREHVFIEYMDPVYPDQLDPKDQKALGAYIRELIVNRYAETLEQNP